VTVYEQRCWGIFKRAERYNVTIMSWFCPVASSQQDISENTSPGVHLVAFHPASLLWALPWMTAHLTPSLVDSLQMWLHFQQSHGHFPQLVTPSPFTPAPSLLQQIRSASCPTDKNRLKSMLVWGLSLYVDFEKRGQQCLTIRVKKKDQILFACPWFSWCKTTWHLPSVVAIDCCDFTSFKVFHSIG